YCGVGVFALCGAQHFERVAGVEINASAVRWANGNAAINGVSNAEFLIGEAEAIFAAVEFPAGETAMILDPPRAGCDELFLKQLLDYAPVRVVYVSCDPATQARDLKILLASGYTLERLQPFDLFPQTRHIENVAVLSRTS
ncbi:MAG: SAM-dependent methyltransferase, partial [Verrucomicrobiota bacterium]